MSAETDERKTERTLRVFISYRHDDAAAARDLERASNALEGVELCTLPSDATAGPRDWRESCRRLIGAADALVCLAGPTTSESPNVAWELEEATRCGIPILLVGPSARDLARAHAGRPELDAIDDAPPEQILARLKELALTG
jgi:hypothetical protein